MNGRLRLSVSTSSCLGGADRTFPLRDDDLFSGLHLSRMSAAPGLERCHCSGCRNMTFQTARHCRHRGSRSAPDRQD